MEIGDAYLLGMTVRLVLDEQNYNGMIQAHVAKGMTYEEAKAETDRIFASIAAQQYQERERRRRRGPSEGASMILWCLGLLCSLLWLNILKNSLEGGETSAGVYIVGFLIFGLPGLVLLSRTRSGRRWLAGVRRRWARRASAPRS